MTFSVVPCKARCRVAGYSDLHRTGCELSGSVLAIRYLNMKIGVVLPVWNTGDMPGSR